MQHLSVSPSQPGFPPGLVQDHRFFGGTPDERAGLCLEAQNLRSAG